MWLNEIIQPPPDAEPNRWLQVTKWQVAVCEADVCAAAILAYFFARHHGKLKHAAEGREDNQIARAHNLKPRRAAESLWFRATDAQIEDAIFFYKRRKFAEAIAHLEKLGFISILRKNPNPNFAADNSRYFRLNAEAVQARLRKIYDYKAELNPSNTSSRKNADTPKETKKSVRKNAESIGKNAESIGKNAEHNNKDIEKEIITGEEASKIEASSSGVESKDDSTPYVGARAKEAVKNILGGSLGIESEEDFLLFLPTALEMPRAVQGHFAFHFWRLHHKHPRAIFDAKRKRAVDDRLKAGYTLDRIILAIRGIKFSAHHMGLNPKSNPDNRIYDDFGLILKDGKQVETFEALAIESDNADRLRQAETALAPSRPEAPPRFSESDVEGFAKTVNDLLAGGYELSHVRAKFSVGSSMSVEEWTRILDRASALRAETNGLKPQSELITSGESDEWLEASEQASKAEGGIRSMPYAREEDFK